MSYGTAVKKYEEKSVVEVRTDWSCRAHGCPNAGTMEKGVCFFHWRAAPSTWPEVTEDIKANFDRMRNWGKLSPERQAMHRAASQKLFNQTGRKPTGLQGAQLPEAE